jgi:pyruvate,water dikinase
MTPAQQTSQPASPSQPLTVTLAAACDHGTALVGSKAAVLSELARDGFAVPEGVVLTTAAFRRAAAWSRAGSPLIGGQHAAGSRAVVAEGPGHRSRWLTGCDDLPADVDAAIESIAAALGDITLAVRSSAVAEDRADASFAGQYESVLGVRGPVALRAAVLRCFSSAFDARIGAYGGEASAPLAVLVQRQVRANAAGVAFTANPVTGARDEVLVSAVPGVGETVAQGTVQPDEWTVTDDGARAAAVSLGALTSQQASEVARLARRIEEHRGAPHDVEWALVDGGLIVLQARPITALPIEPVRDLPTGRTWIKDAERYADPFTALGASVACDLVATGLTDAFASAGALIDRVEARSIGGEVYLCMHTPGRAGDAPPPWWLLAVLARVQAPLRQSCRRARRAVSDHAIDAALARWRDEIGPECDRRASELRQVRLDALTDAELADHLQAVHEGAEWAMARHFALTVPVTVRMYHLASFCDRTLNWPESRTMELLAGASPASAAPTRALRELAAATSERERRAVLALPPGEVLDRLKDAAPRLAARLAGWCERYAFLGMSDDPGAPVFWERPALLERLLVDALNRDGRETADAPSVTAAEAERSALLTLREPERARFTRILERARAAYGVRDDVAQRTGAAFGGLLRLAALEAGRRLVARGALGRREDAVQLDFDTLCAAMNGTATASARAEDLRGLVARAAGERAWVRAHPGRDVVGPVSPAPDLRGLPAGARELNRALLWARSDAGPGAGARTPSPVAPARRNGESGRESREEQPAPAPVLSGVPASPGRCTGVVRVLADAGSAGDLRAGEVLVCRTADPALCVVFGIASALVTDRGGPLSHAAIVARENGIPAVLGTGSATTTLRTGMSVTVDGSAGRIEVCDAGRQEPPNGSSRGSRER